MRKKVVLIGGLGTVGKILHMGLNHTYDLLILDVQEPPDNYEFNYVKADVAKMDQLMHAIPDDAYALVNLTSLRDQPPFPNARGICASSDVYVIGSYNVFLAAAMKNIGKVVFASTNHVTGAYEVDGRSLLGREIRTDDYPLPDSAYGAMKLCAELFGYLFQKEKDISVICLRIGGVKEDEYSLLRIDKRAHQTILSKKDTIEIFRKAIEKNVKYGVYYAVSDNPAKPWDLTKTIADLDFCCRENSELLLKRMNKMDGKRS